MAVIPGTPGDDTLLGTADADYIDGLGGNDRIEGFAGNDTLIGGEGSNDIFGGDGDDWISSGNSGYGFVHPGNGNDTIVGVQNDLEGADLSYIDLTSGGVLVDIAAGTTHGVDKLDIFDGVHRVEGTNFADTLLGSDNDRWEGFDGQDGADFIDGRGGYDELLYHQESGTLGVSVDFILGVAVDTYGNTDIFANMEAVRATRFADTLQGSDQDFESFRGLAGGDIIHGGDGIDLADYSTDEDDGGLNGIVADLVAGTIVDGFGDVDTVSGIEQVMGTSFGDLVVGGAEENFFHGRAGADTLAGGLGDDRLLGGDGNDVLIGGAGADHLNGGDGVDTFRGTVGDLDGDVIEDMAVGEYLYLEDVIKGQWTASLVGTQLSIDVNSDGVIDATVTLIGASGKVLVVNQDLGAVKLAKATPPSPPSKPDGDGPDVVRPDSASTVIHAKGGDDQIFSGMGDDTIFAGEGNDRAFGGVGEDDIYGGTGDDILGGGGGDDEIFAGEGNDTVYGGLGQDFAFGGEGDDLMYMAGGNDIAFGGAGDDRMYGGDGDDTLYGGSGHDQLYGGQGADVFGFIDDSGNDVIYGYEAGDRIALNGQQFTSVINSDGDVVLTLSGGGSIVLDGISTLDPSWFI